MGYPTEMFEVIKMAQPKGKVPDGMKVSFSNDGSGSPASPGPVLAVGDFTLWPMSYYDNRVSLGMVMYDPYWNVSGIVEKPGTRYVYKIDVNGTSSSVVFTGQSNATVSMTFDEIVAMLIINAVEKAAKR